MSRRLKFLVWAPAALWYGVIWRFSAQTATVSGGLSDRLLWRLLEAVSPAFAAAPAAAQTATVELLSFFERKLAHMFLYFVLALLVSFALRCSLRRKRGFQTLAALLICALLAALDEYHQTMVPGRSGEVRDVLVDLTGAAVALAILALPLLADWCRRSMALPALVPAALCLLPLFPALLPGEALAGTPAITWAMEQFVPEAALLSSGEWAALLESLAPVLREVLFLASCGVLGVCAPLAAVRLAGWRSWAMWGLYLGSFAAAALLAAAADLPPAAVGAVCLGAVLEAVLWLAASRYGAYRNPANDRT